MKKYIFSMIFIAGTVFQSCTDEKISNLPPDFASADQAASVNTNVLFFVNNLYTFIPRGYNRLDPDPATNDNANGAAPGAPSVSDPKTAMVASSTDESVHATRNSAAELWGTGQWAPSPQNNWDTQIKTDYTGIRRTFEYTEDINPRIHVGTAGTSEVKPADRDRYLGEALFIRALLNFELLKRYGGYPIVKTQLKAGDIINIPKSSYSECVDYISGLCDQAQTLLTVTPPTPGDFGRATKGAAMALKARLLLYAASPLNNTNNDVAKWKAAADAASVVIKTNTYSLLSAAGGAGYANFFTTIAANPEIILSRLEVNSSNYERMNGLPSISTGLGGTCPSLNLVNDYEMANGTPFDWNNPTMAANPFTNRDPRFANSILYNGSTWMGVTSGTAAVETFQGGKDAEGIQYATRTGFYLRKFLTIGARFVGTVGTGVHAFPIFRYGEVLLNYAEAMNEAYGPDDPSTYGMSARQAMVLIRTRAGLTGNLNVASATTQALMRDAIRHERRIELAFEEHRGFDLRRWKTAETVLNQPVMGLKIVKNAVGAPTPFTYTFQQVENRVFQQKMYFYPFPQDELSRNPGLVQNPGW
ncbi:MAG: RagB/SusD family nutrient uptake outer membrane protein [Bacteroidota bacterium]